MRKLMTYLCMFLVVANLSLPVALAQGEHLENAPQSERETQSVAVVLGIIGIVLGLASIGLGIASLLDKDDVDAGNLDLSLDNPNNFHVGDERVLIVKAPVSHGNIDGSDKGSVKICVSGPSLPSGTSSCQTTNVTGTSVGGEGRQEYRLKYDIEGIDDGTQTISAEVCVTGEDWGFFYDSIKTRCDTDELFITVLDPLPEPWLVPETMLFNHGGFGLHDLKIKNYSEKGGEVYSSWVHHTNRDLVKIAAGDDNGVTTTLVTNAPVPHPGPGHPGQQVAVPFTWTAIGPKIFLRSQRYPWRDDTTAGNATDNCWDPEGNHNGDDTPGSESSDEQRRSSSGSRGTGYHRSSYREAPVALGGIPVIVTDTATGQDYYYYTNENGNFSWDNVLLGPTVDLKLNPDQENPNFKESEILDISLSLFEGHPDVEIYTAFYEAPAPIITGSLGATDDSEMRVFVYSRQDGYDDHFLGEYSGDFQIDGRGMLEFNAENSLLVLEPVPAFNQTLMTDEPLVIPVDMTQPQVDLGDVQFPVVPRSAAPQIEFSGEFMDQETGDGLGGLILEVTPLDPDQPAVTTTTDAAGQFSVMVPNGWATVSSPNGFQLISGVEPDVSQDIDFGANGLGALQIQRVVDTASSTCPADLNGDGIVNAADLAQLLGGWGPCGACVADLNMDGVINAADLAELLGAWGPCAPSPAVCGNGIVEPGEECDPPNGLTCDELCLIVEPPLCACGCDLNCDGMTTDDELADCGELCDGVGDACGDGICEPEENVTNCPSDCPEGCSSDEDCDDANECTVDFCDFAVGCLGENVDGCDLDGEDCLTSIAIFDGDTAFSTLGATTDGPAHIDCEFDGQTFHDIWFDYVATCEGNLTVSTCNQADYDTDVVVYGGCDCPVGDANLLGCNDDAAGCAGFTSEVTVPAVAGDCYKVRVGGWGEGDMGAGILTINCE